MSDTTDRDEALEHSRPAEVVRVLEPARARIGDSIDRSAAAIPRSKELVWARRHDMDHAEQADIRTEVDVSVGVAEHAVESRRQVERLIRPPYFGRVDFRSGAWASRAPGNVGVRASTAAPEAKEEPRTKAGRSDSSERPAFVRTSWSSGPRL